MRLPGNLTFRVGRRLPPRVKQLVNAARGIDMPTLVDRPRATSVAVVAPHPDDELLGCGGSIQKHLAAGEPVTVVFLTSGERTASFAGQEPAARRLQRETEAARACAEIGLEASALRFLRLPDGGVDATHVGAMREAIGDADLVYAPNPIDAHRDHVATSQLLASALDHLPGVRRVALYEVWTPVYPNTIVDISAQIDRKVRALGHYASALDVVDYTHTTRGLAAYRAGHGLHGKGYAEAFTVLERGPFVELVQACAVSGSGA